MAGVEGRVALVTGASRGIGRATAELLASRGATVMCVARGERELGEVGLEYIVADLGTPEGCTNAVTETERRLGPIDILICNHGIGSAHERVVWEQDPEVWTETMRINLEGPFHLSRLVLRGMVERSYGRVVYTSSTSGLVAEPASCAYNSSKHGLIGLPITTRCKRIEVFPVVFIGVRIPLATTDTLDQFRVDMIAFDG